MATAAEIVEIQERIARLKAARSSGLKSVRDRDQEITYRSDAELLAAIRDAEGELETATTGLRRRRRLYTTSQKGL
jgi:hypothetical protein